MNDSIERRLPAALVLLLALIGTGCSQTSSENVTTQGIYADIRIVADGLGATVVIAQLEVGSGGPARTMLDLAPGDTLTVTANGIQKTMIKDKSLVGEISYGASFSFDDPGTQFVVALTRNNGISAPNSNVMLPDGFTVMLPVSATVFGRGETIDVVWAPSATSIVPAVSITVDCILTTGIFISETRNLSPLTDSGTSSIAVDAVIPSGPIDESQLCEAKVNLARERYGNLDPNYGEGGFISAAQHKRGAFFVDPAP